MPTKPDVSSLESRDVHYHLPCDESRLGHPFSIVVPLWIFGSRSSVGQDSAVLQHASLGILLFNETGDSLELRCHESSIRLDQAPVSKLEDDTISITALKFENTTEQRGPTNHTS